MQISLFEDTALPTSAALLSECGTYRYTLSRSWGEGPAILWVMLNPSTADANRDDPTIRKCVGFAKAWGFGSLAVVNLFALRATDPRELPKHRSPIGPENDRHITEQAGKAQRIVCAWGTKGTYLQRDNAVASLLFKTGTPVYVTRFTKDQHPEHPLYLPGNLEPRRW